jgi:hypothetical protein
MRGLLITVVLGAAIVAGCIDNTEGRVIDGWTVGPNVPCDNQRCRDVLPVAAHLLDRRDPRHPGIVGMTVHETWPARAWPGVWIVVFKLIDGSVRALPAGYPGISRKPTGWADYGPDIDPVSP